VPTQEQNVFPSVPAPAGLVLHYGATFSISEGLAGDTSSCNLIAPNDYEAFIRDAVESNSWSFDHGVGFDDEEMIMLVKAIIQRESSWDPRAISRADAYGLMQVTAETGESMCVDEEHGGIYGPDELLEPERNIKCGVWVLHEYMDIATGHVADGDKETAVQLTLASYNAGPGVLSGQSDPIQYEALELEEETAAYVPAVLGHYICYGGSFSSFGGVYYYHDEANRRFVRRPVTLQFAAEDYVPAIACSETAQLAAYHYSDSHTLSDLVCCSQSGEQAQRLLYACNLDIPGLDNPLYDLDAGRFLLCRESSGDTTFRCTDTGFEVVSEPEGTGPQD